MIAIFVGRGSITFINIKFTSLLGWYMIYEINVSFWWSRCGQERDSSKFWCHVLYAAPLPNPLSYNNYILQCNVPRLQINIFGHMENDFSQFRRFTRDAKACAAFVSHQRHVVRIIWVNAQILINSHDEKYFNINAHGLHMSLHAHNIRSLLFTSTSWKIIMVNMYISFHMGQPLIQSHTSDISAQESLAT